VAMAGLGFLLVDHGPPWEVLGGSSGPRHPFTPFLSPSQGWTPASSSSRLPSSLPSSRQGLPSPASSGGCHHLMGSCAAQGGGTLGRYRVPGRHLSSFRVPSLQAPHPAGPADEGTQ